MPLINYNFKTNLMNRFREKLRSVDFDTDN